MKIRNIILHSVLPLLAGVFIYIFFRKPVTFLHTILAVHNSYIPLSPVTGNQFLQFRLPDMCWAYALTSSLILLTGVNKYICAAISILFMSLFEFNQANWHWQHVDFPDWGLMIGASMLAVVLIKK